MEHIEFEGLGFFIFSSHAELSDYAIGHGGGVTARTGRDEERVLIQVINDRAGVGRPQGRDLFLQELLTQARNELQSRSTLISKKNEEIAELRAEIARLKRVSEYATNTQMEETDSHRQEIDSLRQGVENQKATIRELSSQLQARDLAQQGVDYGEVQPRNSMPDQEGFSDKDCIDCGHNIPASRVASTPNVQRCVRCQEVLERQDPTINERRVDEGIAGTREDNGLMRARY